MSLQQRQTSYRESFSVSHSRYRQSHSPSVGRLHKNRQSFGPTVCLISKNPQENMNSIQLSQDKMHILMLILEIQRLNKQISTMKNYSDFQSSSQTEYLKKQVMNLKHALETSENQKMQFNQKNQRFMSSQNDAISDYEAQISVYNRRLRDYEQKNNLLKERINQLQEEATRARAQASRLNMNMLMNSQVELQKSMARERGMEIDLWKQKLIKYQSIINDQKAYINQLRFTVDKMKNGELQMKQRYDYEISNLRIENQDLHKKTQRLQRELNHETFNNTQSRIKEVQLKEAEIQKVRNDLQYAKRDYEEMKNKYKSLEESSEKQTGELKEMVIELRQKLEIMYEEGPKDRGKSDKYRTELAHAKLQNQNLKRQLIQTKKRLNEQIDSLNEELQAKDGKLRKIVKKQKKIENEKRINKSLSVTDLTLRGSYADKGGVKTSRQDLNGIIADVMQLQDSNARISKMIQKKNLIMVGSQVSTNSYLTRVHPNHYGL